MRIFFALTVWMMTGLLSLSLAQASPAILSYQGRILGANGAPLEAASVSFEFTITSPDGQCVIYREQKNGLNMQNSGGVFDSPIGLGTKLYPSSSTFSLLDAFDNLKTVNCEGGLTFTPAPDDERRLRVQFHDGSGWSLIRPDNIIRSVPYAGFAMNSQKLAGHAVGEFVLRSAIPATCTNTQVLTVNSSGVLVCVEDAGGATGTVTSVAGSGPITVSGTTAVTVSASVGTGANQLAAGNDARFTDAREPTGAAGGDLTGTYPDPQIANNAVTAAKIFAGAVTTNKLGNGSVTPAKLSAGSADGQVHRFDGANWVTEKLKFQDLVNAAGGAAFPSGSCSGSQFLTWSSVTDSLACQSLNLGTGANQIPQLNASGKLPDSVLPTAVSDGLWAADSGNVFRTSGSVGIGTNTPTTSLDVVGNINVSGGVSSTGNGAVTNIYAQNGATTGNSNGGSILVSAGQGNWASGTSSSGRGGTATLSGGQGGSHSIGGNARVFGGVAGALGGNGGAVTIAGGSSTLGNGGQVSVVGGNVATKGAGGAVYIASGNGVGTGELGGTLNIQAGQNADGTNQPVQMQAAGGNVSIGVASPDAKLHVNGEIRTRGTDNGFAVEDRANNTEKMIVYLDGGVLHFSDYGVAARMSINRTTGQVGIGVINPSEMLEVDGKIKGTQLCIGGDCRSAWPGTGGGGTVTSITAGTGLSGGTITGSGTIAIANGGVGTTQLADTSVTGAKLETVSGLTASAYGSGTAIPVVTVDTKGRVTAISTASITGLPSGTNGHFLKSNGTTWAGSNILFSDIKNSTGLSAFNISACTANETVKWSALTDMFECQPIGSLNASAITAGTLDAARLPSSITDGVWSATGGNVHRSTGRVGIGISNPAQKLDVDGAGQFKDANGNYVNLSTAVGAGNKGIYLAYDQVKDGSTIQSIHQGTAHKPLFLNPTGGRVGVGTTDPLVTHHVAGVSGVSGLAANTFPTSLSGGLGGQMYVTHPASNYGMVISRAAPDTGSANLTFYHTRSADPSVKAAVTTGDGLGWMSFQGPVDSSNVLAGAGISAVVDAAPTAGATGTGILPTALLFQTANGTSGVTERLRINSAGNIGIGTGAPSEFAGWRSVDVRAPAGGLGATLRLTNPSSDQVMVQVADDGTVAIGSGYPVAGTPSPNNATAPVHIYAGNGPRLTVAASGNVGIGNSNPGAALDVNGTVKATAVQTATGQALKFMKGTASFSPGTCNPAAGCMTFTINFGYTFTAAPVVTLTVATWASFCNLMTYAVVSTTTTSVTVGVTNPTGNTLTASSCVMNWQAMGN